MLVLSRKVGERICIGNDIVVWVTKARGNKVSLGIESPRDMRISRDEMSPRQQAGTQAGARKSAEETRTAQEAYTGKDANRDGDAIFDQTS